MRQEREKGRENDERKNHSVISRGHKYQQKKYLEKKRDELGEEYCKYICMYRRRVYATDSRAPSSEAMTCSTVTDKPKR